MKNNNESKNLKITIIACLAGMLVVVGFTVRVAYGANQMPTESYFFTITSDAVPPYVEGCQPAVNASKVARDTNIKFTLRDAVLGINRDSIDLTVEGTAIIVDGVIQTYINSSGNPVAYNAQINEISPNQFVIVYDQVNYFNYKQVVNVSVNAADLCNNAMAAYSYSFTIQSLISGATKKFPKSQHSMANAEAAETKDNSKIAVSGGGKNVYMVWEEENKSGNRDIYFTKSVDFGETFQNAKNVNALEQGIDHRYADVAVDAIGNVYVVWQEKSALGTWDLYISRLDNGLDFGQKYIVYNDNGLSNQSYPSIAIGAALIDDGNSNTVEPSTIYISWLEESSAVSAVYYTRTTASYSDAWYAFVSLPIRIDDHRPQQICSAPDLKIDNSGNIFVAWRGINDTGNCSIYFDKAASTIVDNGESFGADVEVNTAAAGTTNPGLEVSLDGNDIYVVWQMVDMGAADLEISKYVYDSQQGRYALNNTTQLNAATLAPETLGNYEIRKDNNEDIFVAWTEQVSGNWIIKLAGASQYDYKFEEYAQFSGNGVVAVRNNPCLALDNYGYHYFVSWTDNSSGSNDINLCRNTFINTEVINSQKIENNANANLKVNTGTLNGTEFEYTGGAYDSQIQVCIAEVVAAPEIPSAIKTVGSVVDFGPGGTIFNKEVKIKLPYTDEKLTQAGVTDITTLSVYYYNIDTLAWEKLSGVVVDTAGKMISVPTTHFSIYVIGSENQNNNGGDGGNNNPPDNGGTSNNDGGSTGNGGGGGCFIATAAFGTPMAKEVRILSKFRDECLLTNPAGKKFVKFYYTYSPAIADYIRNKESIKKVVRICLQPLIALGNTLIK